MLKLDIGRKLWKSLADNEGFFSLGAIIEHLRESGTCPDWRLRLTTFVTTGVNTDVHLLRRLVGIGSNEQVEVFDFLMFLIFYYPALDEIQKNYVA